MSISTLSILAELVLVVGISEQNLLKNFLLFINLIIIHFQPKRTKILANRTIANRTEQSRTREKFLNEKNIDCIKYLQKRVEIVKKRRSKFNKKSLTGKAAFSDLAIKFLNDTKLSEPPNARADTSTGRDSDQGQVESHQANHSAAPSVENSLSASLDDECLNEKHDENCAVKHSTGFICNRLEESERDAFLKRIFGKNRNQKKLLEYTVENIFANKKN
ncbi:hypothetical protein BpHYR1_044897 [Brachionus plicatilis]|uniref:Uncharacterized protein n=1 Tax=Brachionus plicatilis TaxID=10195 RepID=A0A3M7P2N6_BRAPC|nr:hypothetical protein BpHYR1_044897 [Brachionus plicatilis]